jgi:hypothetical protein
LIEQVRTYPRAEFGTHAGDLVNKDGEQEAETRVEERESHNERSDIKPC